MEYCILILYAVKNYARFPGLQLMIMLVYRKKKQLEYWYTGYPYTVYTDDGIRGTKYSYTV